MDVMPMMWLSVVPNSAYSRHRLMERNDEVPVQQLFDHYNFVY